MIKFYERYWRGKEELEDFPYKWPVIKKFIPKGEEINILDFGCGKGRIFREIIKINPKARITGVDVSTLALSFARKRFKNYSFIKMEDGEKLPFRNNYFDFIIASDVLEHVYDTQNSFKELSRVLKKDGKILISVPYNGLLKNIIITLFFFEIVFDPYSPHIRFFSERSMRKCLSEVNLKVEKKGYYGRIYPLSRGMYFLGKK